MSAQSYINEIERLDLAIKQYNNNLKKLREQRKLAKKRLLEYMERTNIEKIDKYKKEQLKKEIQPRQKKLPLKERRENTIKTLKMSGIPDPKGYYEKLMSIYNQKKV